MKPEPCYCVDYEEADDDVCACGHTIDEHEEGFFNRCRFTPEDVE